MRSSSSMKRHAICGRRHPSVGSVWEWNWECWSSEATPLPSLERSVKNEDWSTMNSWQRAITLNDMATSSEHWRWSVKEWRFSLSKTIWRFIMQEFWMRSLMVTFRKWCYLHTHVFSIPSKDCGQSWRGSGLSISSTSQSKLGKRGSTRAFRWGLSSSWKNW